MRLKTPLQNIHFVTHFHLGYSAHCGKIYSFKCFSFIFIFKSLFTIVKVFNSSEKSQPHHFCFYWFLSYFQPWFSTVVKSRAWSWVRILAPAILFFYLFLNNFKLWLNFPTMVKNDADDTLSLHNIVSKNWTNRCNCEQKPCLNVKKRARTTKRKKIWT